VADAVEPVAAKYAADRPAGGHRKIHWLMAADGHRASASSVERAPRRRGLLRPIDYRGERRELAKARKAASANGAAFKGAAFARFIAARPELLHIRTRRRSPGQTGCESAPSGR
jgi:hypothetical protein